MQSTNQEANTQKAKQYELTQKERETLQGLTNQVIASKLIVYNANVALEEAQARVRQALAEVNKTEGAYNAALAFLFQSHDIPSGRITPDFTRIEEQQ